MANTSKIHTNHKGTSALDKFSLGYEYNIPWNEASQTIQVRSKNK